jgi:phosphatidylglycerophosphatase A
MARRTPLTASRKDRASGDLSPAVRLLATAGGLGYLPLAPGTYGSALGAVLCLPLLSLPWPVLAAAALVLTAVAVWAAGQVAAARGISDPSEVVIDEVAGMWWAALLLPATPYDLVAVFLLFRLFDVVKPAPIPRLERLPGGLGIVADDVAAGLLARVAWWLLKINFDFL